MSISYIRDMYAKILIALFIMLSLPGINCHAKDVNFHATAQPDGGFLLKLAVTEFVPFSSEGIMYNDQKYYEITLAGKGKDWSNLRNQKGYYYGEKDIKSDRSLCDFGYILIDKERENVYINLYWVSSPDGIRPSDLNGKYELQPQ